ncbi:hypothetical protein [Actinoplanes subglobosus]|uniref:DUF8175 domain-containing protein n=1 Tax=Actinoplanes subglobosus TaxID=1547892 RepID=A0ABV8IR63_9ACTN
MQDEPDFADPSPWTRPWFIAAAGFLGLVVALGVTIAVWPHEQDPSVLPAPAPAVVSGSTSTPSPGAAASGAVAAPLPTALPTSPPRDVTWQLAGQNAVPVSATAGPRSVAAGVASGYARTPEGALVAAAQLAARSAFSAGRTSWEPTVQTQFVPGDDRDRLLAALRSAPEQTADPGELSPLAGYLYQAYTPDIAVIGLVYRSPAAGAARYHVVTTTMQWRDGDWQMVPPPGGTWLSVSRQAGNLSGVVEWGNR